MRAGFPTTIWTTWWRTSSRCARPRIGRVPLMKINSAVLTSSALALCLAASSAAAQVTTDRLVKASAEPQQWMTYSGSYDGSRFSPLDQINRTNVQRLALQWVFQTGVAGRHET